MYMLPGEKMGQIWAFSYILGCWLLLFRSPVSCDSVKRLEASQNGFQRVAFGVHNFATFEKQKLLKAAEDSLRVGRGISSTNPAHTLSTLASSQSKELDDIQRKNVTPRRFLAENATGFDTREALGNTVRRKKKVAGVKKEKRKVGQRDRKDLKGKRFQGAKIKEEKPGKDPEEAQALAKQQQDQSTKGLDPSSVDIGEQGHPNSTKSIQGNDKEVNHQNSTQENVKEVEDQNLASKSTQDNAKKGNDENLELAEEIISPDESEFGTQNNTMDEEGNSSVRQETQDLKADRLELNQTVPDRQEKWVNGTGQESEGPTPEVNNADKPTGNPTHEGNGSAALSIDKQPTSVNVEEMTVNSTAAAEGMEDEYGDFIQEFTDLPSKLQDTAGKVVDRLRPEIEKISNKSKTYFNRANEGITQGFRPLIGNKYAPFLASLVSYIFVLLPLVVVVVLFGQVRTYFPLQKVILYINVYLAAYFATLMIASLLIGMEPMGFFYRNSLSGYIYLQLLEALGYIVYLFLQCLNLIICFSNGPTTAKFAAFLQCAVSMFIGLHSYVTVFHRAMAQKAPRTTWKTHGIYALAFFILCLFAKIKQGKKEYIQEGEAINTNKKN